MGQTTSNIVRKVTSPFWGRSRSDGSSDPNQMAVTPFVFKRRGSMYIDEDGHLAHEFYEEVTDKKTKKTRMRRLHRNLIPQGEIDLLIPRLNVDFPVILCEVFPR